MLYVFIFIDAICNYEIIFYLKEILQMLPLYLDTFIFISFRIYFREFYQSWTLT